jgi:hypothetical protein
MAVVYIEPRPKGRLPVQAYAVETGANQQLATFKSQHTAIDWAKDRGYGICVARIRTSDKGNPDHWRKA